MKVKEGTFSEYCDNMYIDFQIVKQQQLVTSDKGGLDPTYCFQQTGLAGGWWCKVSAKSK